MNVNFDNQFMKLEKNIKDLNVDKIIRKNKVKQLNVKFHDVIMTEE